MSSAYDTQILALTPILFLPCNDTVGGSALADATGNGHAAGLSGGRTLGSTSILPADSETAVVFNGSTGIGVVPSAAAFDVTTGSVELWFKTNVAAIQQLVDRDGLANSGSPRMFHLYLDAAGLLNAVMIWGAVPTITSVSAFNDNASHYCLLRWTWPGSGNTSFNISIDDVQVANGTVAGAMPLAGANLASFDVGAWSNATANPFGGTIQKVAFYGSALSDAQRHLNYLAGTQTVPNAPVLAGSPPVTISTVALTWTDSGAAYTGHTVQYDITNAFSSPTSIDVPSSSQQTDTVMSLSQNTTYYFRVLAYNAAGNGAWSNTVSATTLARLSGAAMAMSAFGYGYEY